MKAQIVCFLFQQNKGRRKKVVVNVNTQEYTATFSLYGCTRTLSVPSDPSSPCTTTVVAVSIVAVSEKSKNDSLWLMFSLKSGISATLAYVSTEHADLASLF